MVNENLLFSEFICLLISLSVHAYLPLLYHTITVHAIIFELDTIHSYIEKKRKK